MPEEKEIVVGERVEEDGDVSLPVIDVLAGRGFITGKSGSGKSNTASVVAEKLLDEGFGLLIVDVDGEYYGLKEEFELLHAGADDECDIVVSPEHAEKLAALALEQNVPIILDVSSYLDESEANEMVLEVTRHLFAKEKKLKKPFLMLVEECHEYIPEGGGMDETGKMLIKVGKRGRKHGLGIVGISQRPADVKKDYITQCDWLVWHRLTWNNDTKVVGRILGSEYANAIEDMGDGEAFMMTDWAEEIRRVQFHRKRTFDAGATPGLEDFERPDLKSVSGDLVSDLKNISDEKERRESELADLRQELEKKQQRISELERELEEARDMSDMADQFAQALLQKAEAPYRGGRGRNLRGSARAEVDRAEDLSEAARAGHPGEADGSHDYPDPHESGPTPSPVPDARDDVRERLESESADGESADDESSESRDGANAPKTDSDSPEADDVDERELAEDQRELHDYEVPPEADEVDAPASAETVDEDEPTEEDESTTSDETTGDASTESPDPVRTIGTDDDAADPESEAERDPSTTTSDDYGIVPQAMTDGEGSLTATAGVDNATGAVEDVPTVEEVPTPDDVADPTADRGGRLDAFAEGVELRSQEAVVRGFVQAIRELDDLTRGMLAHYCRHRRSTPVDAHVAAGGSGDRHFAYSRNRTLRQAGLVEHERGGHYRYALSDLVEAVFTGGVSGQDLADTVAAIEMAAGLVDE